MNEATTSGSTIFLIFQLYFVFFTVCFSMKFLKYQEIYIALSNLKLELGKFLIQISSMTFRYIYPYAGGITGVETNFSKYE